MICKCGNVPLLEPVIENSFARYVVRCEKCGKKTQSWVLENSAIKEWERINKNFSTCGECENFQDPGLCIEHDTGTEGSTICQTCGDYGSKTKGRT